MNNNNLLFNAALAGFLAGTFAERNIEDSTPADYTVQVNAAIALATEVDGAIPNDPNISGAGGVTLIPTTAAIQDAQVSQANLLEGIVSAVFSGRYVIDPVAVDYSVQAGAIAALYTKALASLAVG